MPGNLPLLDIKVKKLFLDSRKIIDPVAKAEIRMLNFAGGLIRTIARRLLKRRKSTSAPGNPPHVHSRNRISLKTILFVVDRARGSVTTGPLKFNQTFHSRRNAKLRGDQTVPNVLQFGGTIGFREKLIEVQNKARGSNKHRQKINVEKKWVPIGRGARKGQPTRLRYVNIAPRPWMDTALEKAVEHDRFPKHLKAGLRGF